jgi:hypothetical protein
MPESDIRLRRRKLWKGIGLVAIGAALVGGMAVVASSQGPDKPSLAALYAEIVPAAGTETIYGMPLAWENAQLFASWYDAVRLTPREARVMAEALEPLRAPCCDDNPLAKCCCERGGLICNLVRTTRGLGAYLVREGVAAAEVRAAMVQWMKFVHGDYYVAQALVERGDDPIQYGLFRPANGSCYRGMCGAPLREGGCGGMGPQVIVDRPKN